MRRLIVELDDELHRKMKLKAFASGKTIKQYVTELIEKDVQKEKE